MRADISDTTGLVRSTVGVEVHIPQPSPGAISVIIRVNDVHKQATSAIYSNT